MKYFLFLLIPLFIFAGNDNIKVTNAWFRLVSEGMTTGLFFTVENTGDKPDTLYNISSNISDELEIHETYSKGNDQMGMRQVDFIVIPAKSTFEFKPRSFHVMVFEVKKDMPEGSEGEFTLYFKQAGKIKIIAVSKEV